MAQFDKSCRLIALLLLLRPVLLVLILYTLCGGWGGRLRSVQMSVHYIFAYCCNLPVCCPQVACLDFASLYPSL